ncbi:chromosome segregation protein SMC [Rheinheimera sp.]|uniref:chromosome segregation protein SMC n=1 Tax=Rheinheimera sp. TaxID=1869214 RepID=UPI003AF7FE7F
MRLKQIKLAGFKSFVDPTAVGFPAQMTAVVGPNGCGKSNVIDAVRWVLGESSAKNLRGDAMTDVIFNGSTQRKPVSQASVELVFENTQGRLQGSLADRSEISIKRLVTRDAQSSYFLNGSKCRRRDITDIFLGTGLGPRSYAIIEQGMISRLIESKPAELRIFIEEAAGISKYKERRRDTENRIKHTRENLDRLSDVREELGKNLEKLKRQASAAARFKELKTQERKLKAELACLKWLHFHGLQQQSEQEILAKQTEIEKFQASQSGDELQLLQLKQQQQAQRDSHQQTQARYYQLGNQITRLEQNLLHQRQQRQRLSDELRTLQLTLTDADEHLAQQLAQQQELQEQLLGYAPQLDISEVQLEQLTEQLEQASELLAEQQQGQQQQLHQRLQLQQQLQQNQFQQRHQQEQQQAASNRMAELEPQLQVLAQQQQPAELAQLRQELELQQAALAEFIRQISQAQSAFEQAEQHWQQQRTDSLRLESSQQSLQQQHQKLQQKWQQRQQQSAELLAQLQPDPSWALAVATALSGLQQAGLSEQHQSEPTQAYVLRQPKNKTLGTLAAVVDGLVPDYFNQILLLQSPEQLQTQLSQLAPGQSLICQDGRWFGSNWGQLAQDEQDNSLVLQHQLSVLELELQQLEPELQLQHLNLQQAEQQLQQDKGRLQQLQQQKDTQQAAVQQLTTACLLAEQQQRLSQQQLQHTQLELSKARQQAEQSAGQLDMLQQQQEELQLQQEQLAEQQYPLEQQLLQSQQQVQQLRQQYDLCRQQLQQLKLEQQSAQKQLEFQQQSLQRGRAQQEQLQLRAQVVADQLAELAEPDADPQEELQILLEQRAEQELLVAEQSQQLQQLDDQLRQLEQGQQGLNHVLAQKQRELTDLQLAAEGYRVRATNMLEQLTELQVNFRELSETLPAEADEVQWQQQLEKTQDSISRLGPINLAAIEEFEQQDERKKYLDTQHQDLTDALDTLETAIRKIDRETRQKFKETFEQVNEGLQNLFPKVFGGGSAYLDLTEEDLLETGVTIMARPPGKKNSTIHLLSGGEKALTALSLVFSIFRLNPAPFCMLDEVDAPLDDANTGRFCNLVREMSETVQFIYISHNKIAMEMAAQLMGVTMQEPGVSRVVAVDVEDAVKMAQA